MPLPDESDRRFGLGLVVWLLVLDAALAGFLATRAGGAGLYFLNVGQGDSELVRTEGGADVLIDGGPPNMRAVKELERILSFFDRSVDVVVMSHAQADHFGGLVEVLRRYRVGVFVWNGVPGTAASLVDVEAELMAHDIPVVELHAGDVIRHGGDTFSVVWPPPERRAADLNDAALVLLADVSGTRALFTGDISAPVEREMLARSRTLFEGGIDVLKVAHHGSGYSTSAEFLTATCPRVAVVEVGENRYGHPAAETLERLAGAGAAVYRTDMDGTVIIK